MKREIEFATDLDGTPLVIVPVGSGDQTCTVEKADYDFLIKSGVGSSWWVSNGRYVTALKNGKHEYIARLICMCTKGQSINYRDGNSLNLRRSNLGVMEKRQVPVTFQPREAA